MVKNKEDTKRNGFGLCLYILLCIIVVVLSLVSVGVYFDLKTSRLEDKGLLARVGQQMIDTRINEKPEDKEKLKHLRTILKDFRVIVEGMAQNDNISFLFTVFSIALVSGSAYLLERSRQNVKIVEGKMDKLKSDTKQLQKDTKEIEKETKDTKKAAEKVKGYLNKKPVIDNISEGFLKAEDISNELQYESNVNVFLSLLPAERQELDKIYKYLENNKSILDRNQIENYKKKTFGIKVKLQSVQLGFQVAVQELVTKCDKITKLCKSR